MIPIRSTPTCAFGSCRSRCQLVRLGGFPRDTVHVQYPAGELAGTNTGDATELPADVTANRYRLVAVHHGAEVDCFGGLQGDPLTEASLAIATPLAGIEVHLGATLVDHQIEYLEVYQPAP